MSAVTKAGPPTKITSSATDSNENAVCSLAGSASTCDQRARTSEPSEIPVAPDTAPAAYSVHSGVPEWAHSIRVVSEQACISTSGTSTRAWPNRSTSRPVRGPATATAIEKVAATAPAFAYEPVIAVISRMTPMPSIDMGARPMNPAMTKPLTPGVPNSPRYGPTILCFPFGTVLGTVVRVRRVEPYDCGGGPEVVPGHADGVCLRFDHRVPAYHEASDFSAPGVEGLR